MPRGYTHIVIGAGAIGSATAYWLSQTPGTRVLVLEQDELVNTRNSSGDVSRIIRHAYHSTAYTALTPAMFEAWAHVEEQSGPAGWISPPQNPRPAPRSTPTAVRSQRRASPTRTSTPKRSAAAGPSGALRTTSPACTRKPEG